ncbi:MAG: 2-phospho-L-lactate transferase [Acidimicrobiales bacterium]
MIVALAGGVGAARMLSGLVQVVDPAGITAVINTADDMVIHGLHISPDIDTVTYTLAGIANTQAGWGLAGETWVTMRELELLGGESWFRLGDRDLATHLYRTQRLSEGASLSQVTSEIATSRTVVVRLLPMSDDPVSTRLVVESTEYGDEHVPGPPPQADRQVPPVVGVEEVAFQDYFVRRRHQVPVRGIRFAGADEASPAAGVLDAVAAATRVIVCPSNPLVSIAPILSLVELRNLLAARRKDIVAVSPIVGGVALKGPADRLLVEMGHESSVVGVARLYAPWVSTLVIDVADADLAPRVEEEGMKCVVTDTVMSTPERAASLAKVVLDAGR